MSSYQQRPSVHIIKCANYSIAATVIDDPERVIIQFHDPVRSIRPDWKFNDWLHELLQQHAGDHKAYVLLDSDGSELHLKPLGDLGE